MKKLFAFIISVSLLLSVSPLSTFSAAAQSEYGNFEYDVIDGKIKIIGYDKSAGCPSRIVIPSEIEGLPVTEIGDFVFMNFADLETVEIPSGVKSIGERAFEGCALLKAADLPSGIREIGNYAFSECRSLESVSIPNGVTAVKRSVFYMCGGLKKISFPSSVTSIENAAFKGCGSLESIELPDGLTDIGASAFEECEKLTSVDIPSGVRAVGESAFSDCGGLKNVTLHSGISEIGKFAFYCTGLTAVTIPESVTVVGEHAFSDCNNLAAVNFLSYNAKIDYNAFSRCVFTMRCQAGSTAEAFAKKKGIACETVNFSLKDETSGITVTNSDGSAFDKDTLLLVGGISDAETVAAINRQLPDSSVQLFGISLIKYGIVIQPVKELILSVTVNSGMNSAYCKVYSAEKDGSLTEIKSVCRENKMIFSVSSLGNFVIAEQLPAAGDVSGDGRVTVTDALMVLQHCVGMIAFDEQQLKYADVDLNGRIDTTDALLILQFTVKKIDKFPSRR